MKEETFRYDRRTSDSITYFRGNEHPGVIDSQKVDIRAVDVWSTGNKGEMIWVLLKAFDDPCDASGACAPPDNDILRLADSRQIALRELFKKIGSGLACDGATGEMDKVLTSGRRCDMGVDDLHYCDGRADIHTYP
jgi:hypothetical protein